MFTEGDDLKAHTLQKLHARNQRVAPCLEELLLPGYTLDDISETAKTNEWNVVRYIETEPLDPFRVFVTRMALANGVSKLTLAQSYHYGCYPGSIFQLPGYIFIH